MNQQICLAQMHIHYSDKPNLILVEDLRFHWIWMQILFGAVGVESQFENTTEVNYQSYKANGGLCRLQLTPKAWVKVKAVDIEPLNPEVL